MITSKLTTKAQTTLPRAVRSALGVGPGDALAYKIDGDIVTLSRAATGCQRIPSQPSPSGIATPTARPTPIFRQGDVVRVPFPYTDRTTRQRRPALVVSNGHLGRDGTLLWVAMITSADNAPWPSDVPLSASPEQTGLKAPSVVRPSKLATIEAAHAEPLGDVGRELLDLVIGAIREQMGIGVSEMATP